MLRKSLRARFRSKTGGLVEFMTMGTTKRGTAAIVAEAIEAIKK